VERLSLADPSEFPRELVIHTHGFIYDGSLMDGQQPPSQTAVKRLGGFPTGWCLVCCADWIVNFGPFASKLMVWYLLAGPKALTSRLLT
jgi:hypothetical protein